MEESRSLRMKGKVKKREERLGKNLRMRREGEASEGKKDRA